MKNNAPLNNISSNFTDKSFKIANHIELKQNGKTENTFKSKTQCFELLPYEADNFRVYSNQICQSWLKAHKTKFLDLKNIQEYTKIVIVLQDIVELIEKIETTIQCAKSQKLEIHQTVCTIISSCLDIEPEQVTPTTNLVNDLGKDSLSWQELLITLEERFSIEISDEITGTLSTVQQIVDCITLIVRKKINYCLKYDLN